ncbi:MAG: cell division protein FtsW [Candidatus Liptonbacteria bacterium]|nr:cell division protein FtsW [Candidatus Liptonbacteria bacterium]
MKIPIFSRRNDRPDYLLVGLVVLLSLFGLAMLSSASSSIGASRFGNPYYYVTHQLLSGFLPGIVLFLVLSKMYYKNLKKFAFFLLLLSVVGLVLVFTPLRVSLGGAARWIAIGPVTFQPAEFVKLAYLLYVAAWFSNLKANRQSLTEGFLPFLGITGLIAFLLILQPATSMIVVLLAAALGIYFLSGAKLRYIALMVLVGAIGLGAVIAATPYRWERIRSYLAPSADEQGAAYHLKQLQIAIGSGGLFGVGYGQSKGKETYLPEPIGDSLFAVYAEEFGFVGATVLVGIFLAFVIDALLLARRCRDEFGKLVLAGFGTLFGVQAFIHIGANLGLIPLTGMPLPFMSFGGSALISALAMAGIMVNVSRYAER